MKKIPPSARLPLTKEELQQMEISALLKIKLTPDESVLLREINEARNQERLASVARIQIQAAPIMQDLKAIGIEVPTLSSLTGKPERSKAIPILLRHLQMPYCDVLISAIARCLAVPDPEVRKAWPMLVEKYRNAPTGLGFTGPGDTKKYQLQAKDALASTLVAIVTRETLGELIDLLKDQSHGEYRLILLLGLRKSKDPRAKQAIEELASDPVFKDEIASWRKRK